MLDRCRSIYFGFMEPRSEKKAGTKGLVPALSWLVARIKLRSQSFKVSRFQGFKVNSPGTPSFETLKPLKLWNLLPYAVLLGLIVKSRNWVRTLDICIPFSCETNGRISAMN
jgi:hypothetical protein